MEMYDFYRNPPKTKEDLRNWLSSWLQKPSEEYFLTIHGEIFIQEYGFRRAFNIHSVYRSLSTNEYVWWVYENEDIESFPKKRFSDFDSMLNHVIDDYYIRWKLQN